MKLIIQKQIWILEPLKRDQVLETRVKQKKNIYIYT